MSAEDNEYMDDYKEFPTKESALDWLDNYLSLDERNNLIKALEQEPIDYKAQYERFAKKAEIVISQLRADRDRLADVLDKIRAEIAQLPTKPDIDYPEIEYVDVTKNKMLDIIDKYKAESEE